MPQTPTFIPHLILEEEKIADAPDEDADLQIIKDTYGFKVVKYGHLSRRFGLFFKKYK